MSLEVPRLTADDRKRVCTLDECGNRNGTAADGVLAEREGSLRGRLAEYELERRLEVRYFERAGLRGSLLGLGCASVMGRVGRTDALRAMGLAWDDGINVFDVARSYGFGAAEDVLGEFLQTGRRAEAVVVTKFGIWPETPSRLKNALKPAVRMVRTLVPRARPLIKRMASKNVQSGQFSVLTMRASLGESLRQLRTDYVDVLLVHGATASVMAAEDLVAALQDVVASGKALLVGVSSGPTDLQAMSDANLSVLQAMQMPINLFDLSGLTLAGSAGGRLAMGNHPFGGLEGIEKGKALLESMSRDETIPAEIRARLMHVDNHVLADVVLNVLLRDTGVNTVIPSMMKPGHLRTNVDAINQSAFDDAEIALLRQRLLSLPGPMLGADAIDLGHPARPTSIQQRSEGGAMTSDAMRTTAP